MCHFTQMKGLFEIKVNTTQRANQYDFSHVLQNLIRFTRKILNPLVENPTQCQRHFHPNSSPKNSPNILSTSFSCKVRRPD